MRGFFHRGAKRDSLRPELKQQFNKKAPNKGSSRPSFRHVVSAFLLAALAHEGSSFHKPENPHGNRRERIEEMRIRAQQHEVTSRNLRNANLGGGGNPPEPNNPMVQVALENANRRRNVAPGLDV